MIYSEELKKLKQNMINFIKNNSIDKNKIVNTIKKVIDKYSNQEINTNKRINLIIKQLLMENKFLRKLIITQIPTRNYFFRERQNLINEEYKLNFNYNFLENLNKIDIDLEKKFNLNTTFNPINIKHILI